MNTSGLDRLQADPTFFNDFVKLLEQRTALHTDELRRATNWDDALRAQGKVKAIDELKHLFTFQAREGEQRERYRKQTA